MTIVIRGGSVVSTSGATPADVVVDGERIAAILDPDSTMAESVQTSADRVIDASGCYVLPGGVDAHVHLELEMTPEATSADTFATGTAAAAWGGTTTVIDFAGQTAGTHVRDAIEARHADADGQCAIDYGFHLAMGDIHDASLAEMEAVMQEGITSFKYFMAYPGAWYSDDGKLLRAMQRAAELGSMVMMHAENGIAIDVLRDQAAAAGQTAPIWHGRTRPSRLEGEAVHRAAALAEIAGAPLYIVHLSSSDALDQVRFARDRGQNVFAETCPQYLYLTLDEHLDQPGCDGLTAICSPPLRDHTHHADLWHGLRRDELAVVATDHCPFCDNEKLLGADDFRATPNGLGSIEHRMDLLHTGVVEGEIGLARWVEVCSTTPARLFGFYPRKGVIAPGSDADIVVYDPAAQHTLGVASHHMNVDNSVWEGVEVTGQVRTVLSRGSFVIDERTFTGRAGHGRFVKRQVSDLFV
ncbi:MAG: dihydropyrimidinase [Acidimicrobiales bacterium]